MSGRLRVAFMCSVVIVAGCTGSSPKQAATSSGAAPGSGAATGSGSGWIRTDLKPVSQPYRAGDRFVLYVAGPAGLQVVGLDAKTGTTVWKADASASGVTQGVAPTFAIDGTSVVFLRDAGKGS